MNDPAKVIPIVPPPVAPPAAPRRPDTLADMWRKAKVDIGEKEAYWAFQHAKAAGRRERADRELKRLEGELTSIQYRAASMTSDAAIQLLLANAPDPLNFHKLDTELADATELETATATVLRLLTERKV